MSCCNDSAWEASSSAVEASSSAEAAFACVVWSICIIARFIWVTFCACSPDVAETSFTSASVFWMAGRSRASACPDASAVATLAVAFADLLRRGLAAVRELAHLVRHHREASPMLPARAASMAAFSASRLVWSAISSMMEILLVMSRIASMVRVTACAP